MVPQQLASGKLSLAQLCDGSLHKLLAHALTTKSSLPMVRMRRAVSPRAGRSQ